MFGKRWSNVFSLMVVVSTIVLAVSCTTAQPVVAPAQAPAAAQPPAAPEPTNAPEATTPATDTRGTAG